MDPIVSIFGVCDAEADDKLSMKEIKGNADCWNMLENAGMQNTSITDEFLMIDKDQDGYVSMDEAYIAANNLERTKKRSGQQKCHPNFGGYYTAGNSPQECDKCMRWGACQAAKNDKYIVKCMCTTGRCEAHKCGPLGCGWSGSTLEYVCQVNP